MDNNTKLQITKILQSTNHYQVLGIKSNATQKQIKQAYKSNVLKYHPDKTSIPQAKEIFGKVSNAYQKLSQSEERLQYDQQLLRKSKQMKSKSQGQQSYQNDRNKPKDSSQSKNQFRKYRMNAAEQNKKKYDAYFKPPPNPYNPKRSQQNSNNGVGQKNNIKHPKRRMFPNKTSNLTTIIVSLILFYIFWSFMPGYVSPQPRFMFMKSDVFNLKMRTQRYNFVFFIKPQNVNKTSTFEQQVEQVYINKLQKQCEVSLTMKDKQKLISNNKPLDRKIDKNQYLQVDYKSCKKLLKIIKKYPEIKLKRFPHLNK